MVCPKCGSDKIQAVSNTHGKIHNKDGCLMWCVHAFLVLCTCGLWIIYLVKRNKIKTTTEFVCLNCGNKWH
jgi:predicted RNA-binding Zn-ribbon protein involved in translation (DUF1610 family)